MSGISALEETTRPKQGNRPSYDEAHVVWALNLIGSEPPLGRLSLMKRLGLGEASVKTMLKRLRESGLIKVDRVGGAELTDKGKSIVEEWKRDVTISTSTINSLGWDGVKVVIRKGERLVTRLGVINLRDSIIRLGAEAVLIVVKTQTGVEIPPKTEEFTIRSLLDEVKRDTEYVSPGDLIVYLIPKDLHLAYKVGLYLLSHEDRTDN
ncbi:hypothetical protein MetMK1DRAFT_00028520 [Metallosphaera yellowstonensis MK1]|jgi:predicted transcriptional regulator|uniref:DUF4443 domain-containing protein n=1 Tax=Metallosphaera yellowstonensis MK1 TaxID=671065 RepID=H2C8E3_9CREN|nr:DUF4443 domain-containing protein [Metallosphaera yellowstonensis]EHP68419.1 hypothetical protein MetMK1DRAFT_00028520 [Metallosphaera yellowstonensis MK1]